MLILEHSEVVLLKSALFQFSVRHWNRQGILHVFLEVSGLLAWHLEMFEAGKKFNKIFRNPSFLARSCWENRVIWWEGNSKHWPPR